MKAAPWWRSAASISGTSWPLSPEKLRATKVAPSCKRHADHVDCFVAVHDAALGCRTLVGRGRELALGQAVDAVVLDDIDHVHAAAHGMRELADADRGEIAVARHAKIDQIAVREVGPGQHRRHPPMHRVEPVRGAEEIGRRLRRAADARQLGDPMRRQVELETRAHDGRADRIVPATGAEGGDRALVVAAGEAERVRSAAPGGAVSAWEDRSWRRLSGTGDLGALFGDGPGDEAGGDRRAVVVQRCAPASPGRSPAR